jgi:hypothetical protein
MKMAIPTKAMYRYNAIRMSFFAEAEISIQKFTWKQKKKKRPPKAKAILSKKSNSRCIIILYSNYTSEPQ